MSTALKAWWPINHLTTDLDRTLIDDAVEDLPALAMRAHARITGQPRWHIVPGRTVPGAGAYPWVLVCLVPAVKVDHLAAAREACRLAGV